MAGTAASKIAVKRMRQMYGSEINVVLGAPDQDANPIHTIAKQTGVGL